MCVCVCVRCVCVVVGWRGCCFLWLLWIPYPTHTHRASSRVVAAKKPPAKGEGGAVGGWKLEVLGGAGCFNFVLSVFGVVYLVL